MIKFDKEKVLLLQQFLVAETGGSAGVRDLGLLDTALESAFQTFDGKDLFPTKYEKAAKLGFSLISNHAFLDGNKRIGMYVMISFLEINGIRVETTAEEIARVGLAVASGNMKYDELLSWVIAVTK